jgi:nitrite reductase/ring-hydroxylating ferredoxin subunit
MAARERVIASGDALAERGRGVGFEVVRDGKTLPAFAIRVEGIVRAYVNACAHQGLQLDWNPGEFFDDDRRFLECTAHGARYDPASGACEGGPCRGKGLVALEIVERDGHVWLIE